MLHRRTLLAIVSALTALAAIAATAFAQAARDGSTRHPFALLSHAAHGGAPNAPATDPAISGDGRIARYAAYVSAASDIVSGSGAHRNVYLVERARPWGENGTFWRQGATVLVSRGLGGQPADGDSWGPVFDGFEGAGGIVKPSCLAFVSAASNLVRSDDDGRADAFVRDLPDGRLMRIAARKPVTEVAVDGRCRKLAYVAGGRVYLRPTGGHGKARRASGPGASHPHLSTNGAILTYERDGTIYAHRERSGDEREARGRSAGTWRIARGQDPSGNAYGTYVAFTRGGEILEANLLGRVDVGHVRQYPGGQARGEEPSMTAGHAFVFYVEGSRVRSSSHATTMGDCGGADARQPAASAHGNYVAFACAGGPVYLTYVGPK